MNQSQQNRFNAGSKSGTIPKLFSNMSLSSVTNPKLEGTRGRVVNLQVNYLKINVDDLISKAFHYDVKFFPEVPKKMLGRALDIFMQEHFPLVFFGFDGRNNFYTNVKLPIEDRKEITGSVKATLNDRSKEFKITVQLAAEIDLSVLKELFHPRHANSDRPSQAIQCLDVVLRTAFNSLIAKNLAVAAARALYFLPEGRPLDLEEGMELWYGLFQSAILGRKSLHLNVDVAHKAFPSAISVLEVIKSLNRGCIPKTLDKRQKDKLHDYLKMLSISYRPDQNIPLKTFGYNGLVGSSRDATFIDSDGRSVTVLSYYEYVKRIPLRYPDLPCMHVGSKVRNIYLPMEFCVIPAGQATNKKCTPICLAKMIKFSATSTDDRKKKIKSLVDKINYGEVEGFGVEIEKKFQNVEGRVLAPPRIKYINGVDQPKAGVWRGKKFLETQQNFIKWAILNCDDRTSIQQVMGFKGNIIKEAKNQGMKLEDSRGDNDYFKMNFMRSRQGDMEKILENLARSKYDLVFIIIVDQNDCYAKVKQVAELKIGILTQCIKANTIFRMDTGNPLQTIGNILLKVNAKLNGKNHEVIESSYQSFGSGGVMFVGADVTHPSPDQRDFASVVGIAASMDDVGSRYQCDWRLQGSQQEMIVDLEDILVKQLQAYHQKNRKLPAKLMYYRDGVSDGQFPKVLDIEMKAIRGALKRVYGSLPPAKVTFIVIQKRHHTRFFPTNGEGEGKNNNICAGTVVDKDIMHPFQYQFFLASHAAIQGVTKPAKYCVLVNESNISPDDLQAITYDLCHLFTRCNRSVSYPAPTYYAHLVASRGKEYIRGASINMDNLGRENKLRGIHSNIAQYSPMFFV